MNRLLGLATVATLVLHTSAVPLYGQCGGLNYTGDKTCDAGSVCTYVNDWYSQCLPGNGGGATTTTTTRATTTATTTRSTATSTGTFRNPIRTSNGSDPHMVYSNGYYYLTATTWSNIQLTRATSINGLKTATPKTVWTDSNSSRCCNFWAPEIYNIDGVWYIYYTGGPNNGSNYDGQRIHVIRGSSSDLWASSWSYVGKITPPNRDKGSIDGTILKHSTGNYLIYSGWESDGQDLFIAKFNTGSTTAVGNAVKISVPTYSWEKEGYSVNEGPSPLYRNGRTFMTFSASLCSGTGYKLGLFELKGDPMTPSAWSKFSSPVFTTGNGVYQPGHNANFQSPSGAWWNVYHANTNTPGQCDGSRYTAVQPINWNGDGTPNFGSPIALSQSIPEPY